MTKTDDPVVGEQVKKSQLPPLPPKISYVKSPITGRLDAALRASYHLSHKAARKLISTGKVSVGEVPSLLWETPVSEGDVLTVNPTAPNPAKREALGATLVFQDEAIAVLSKPAGLLSAPGYDEDEVHALQAATRLCKGPRRPRVVHRLDKETSGLLIFARTIPSARRLQEMLQDKSVKRIYRCVVRGEVQGDGEYISSHLVRDAGRGKRGSLSRSLKRHSLRKQVPKEPHSMTAAPSDQISQPKSQWALTRYQVVARKNGYTALEVELFTGRTHQIRIHLSEIGHPIVGEWVYAPRKKRETRLALHAARLQFMHPFTDQELKFEAGWPSDLSSLTIVPKSWQVSKGHQNAITKGNKKRTSTRGSKRS